MEDKILAIVNPVSANGKTGKLWPEYEKMFQNSGILLDINFTQRPLQAVELAKNGIKKGYRKIMAVGGDGTVNEIINGLFKDGELLKPEIELIIFSQGTGSDYIKSINLSRKPEDIIKIIRNGTVQYFDLGQVTYITHKGQEKERYFINVADMGIGGETTYLVNKSSKILGGFLTYLIGVLRALLSYKNKVVRLKIDGKEILHRKINSVMVANGEYFGGGINIAPGADPADGRFNIVILGDLSKLEIIINLARAYRGTHLDHPKVKMVYGQELIAECEERMLVELDGETVGRLPVKFNILKNKLPVLIK